MIRSDDRLLGTRLPGWSTGYPQETHSRFTGGDGNGSVTLWVFTSRIIVPMSLGSGGPRVHLRC